MNLTPAPQTHHRPAFGAGVTPDWFHGSIPRKAAEELLVSKPRGYFLIRVGESRAGYTLSHRGEDRTRHFMINVAEDGYVVVGEQRRHRTLHDLVDFHRRAPITPYGEVLTVACGKDDGTDYAELLFPQRGPGNAAAPQPNGPPLPGTSGPAPPALPYRPARDPEAQDPPVPISCPDAVTSPQPVPMPRKRYKTDQLPSSRCPVVPVRSAAPQDRAGVPLPPSPSVPPPRKDPACSNADTARNLAAKLSVVSTLKVLNKVFQTKKGQPRGPADADNDYEEVSEDRAPRGPRVLPADAGLPQEYLPPPPFAPGY